jgi:hypothetical protein
MGAVGLRRADGEYGRVYIDDAGVEFPSVTSVIDAILPAARLDRWKQNLVEFGLNPDEVSRPARELGTAVHEAVERHHRGLPLGELPPEVAARVDAYLAWLPGSGLEVTHPEVPVINRGLRYAGTCDGVGVYRDRPVVFDLKTGSGVWPAVALQLVAYKNAESAFVDGAEIDMPQVEGGIVLHLSDVGMEVYEVQVDEVVLEAWVSCLRVFRFAAAGSKAIRLLEEVQQPHESGGLK